MYWIKEFNSKKPNGYNLADGGKGSKGCKHTEEWKKTHSKRMEGKNNPMYGIKRKHSIETIEKMKISHTGIKQSEETIEKKSKKVYQYDLNYNFIKEYKSLKEAESVTKITCIVQCCNNVKYYKHAGGYIWSYKKLTHQELYFKINNSKKNAFKKEIYQYQGVNLINKYNSIKDASNKTGITNIMYALNPDNKYKMAGGYIWSYFKFSYEEIENIIQINICNGKKPKYIGKFNYNEELLETFKSIKYAAKKMGTYSSGISRAISFKKPFLDYIWKEID